jgi:multisubunit Na+/H+ antiporter MnhC subunit
MSADLNFGSRPPCTETAFDHALQTAQKVLVLTAAVIAVLITARILGFWWEHHALILEEIATISPI